MSLLGDDSPSCPVCGSQCIGFVNKTKPISLQPLSEQGRQMVQSSHLADESENKVVEDKSQETTDDKKSNENKRFSQRAVHPQKNRAHSLAQDRAHHPEGDR